MRRALAYEFSVTVEGDDALDAHVDALFAGLAAGSHGGSHDAEHWIIRESDRPGEWLVLIGDERVAGATRDTLLGEVVRVLNARAIPTWDGVVCHAGAVTYDGTAVLLPAASESGKSTLTAGLVRAGFDYLSDEGVAFHPDVNLVEPYPKPLSLDPGSWHLFPELAAEADGQRDQWQIAPAAIRANSVAAPSPAGFVVFPRYDAHAATELRPMRRAEALIELVRNTFAFDERSRFALEQLAAVVADVDCYRLTVGSLDAAVAELAMLVGYRPVEASTGG